MSKSLLILAFVHVLSGLILGFVAEDGPASITLVTYIGLFFSHTSLLGIWGGLAMFRWPIRLAGVVIGIGYLTLQFCFSLGGWEPEICMLVFLSTALVAGVMVVVRQFVARLECTTKTIIPASAEGLQFSIAHLMLLTLAVGGTLAIGRSLQPYFSDAHQTAFLLTICICFVSVGLGAAWAQLGRANVIFRSLVVLFIAALTGCIPAYVMKRGDLWSWIVMMIVEAVSLLTTLYVVRRNGYRLVRLSYGKGQEFP